MSIQFTDTIVALATPPGVGAIGVIRISGDKAISITNNVFKGKDLAQQSSHTLHLGTIHDKDIEVDEVLVSLFRTPHSYTKEDVVEISGHGSPYVLQQIIQLLIKAGARHAKAGEFTLRAFVNGRFDLSQAEAVADIIASDNAAAQAVAFKQMRGGFSNDIKQLRQQLIHIASLLELELDFGEEDVEFASRAQLVDIINQLAVRVHTLLDSFKYGNVIKNGVTTVIAGRPNAGKSTLLNTLLNEDRAIVSDIAGTTRDAIEAGLVIEGIRFRLIDTAGLREATDTIERIGVQKTMEKISQSSVVVYVYDMQTLSATEAEQDIKQLNLGNTPVIIVANKADLYNPNISSKQTPTVNLPSQDVAEDNTVPLPRGEGWGGAYISAKNNTGIDTLKATLVKIVTDGKTSQHDTVLTNIRHYEALSKTEQALSDVLSGINSNMSKDLIAGHIRHALHYLGEITGEITTDDILDNIFSKFCIGK